MDHLGDLIEDVGTTPNDGFVIRSFCPQRAHSLGANKGSADSQDKATARMLGRGYQDNLSLHIALSKQAQRWSDDDRRRRANRHRIRKPFSPWGARQWERIVHGTTSHVPQVMNRPGREHTHPVAVR